MLPNAGGYRAVAREKAPRARRERPPAPRLYIARLVRGAVLASSNSLSAEASSRIEPGAMRV
eukprot:COSAG06_NODE_275_length_18581_cov_31.316145_5_plen_62_part_00